MTGGGTDPRNLDREKIFSAFPVKHNDVLQGYLYAVLGGAKYDELANSIRGSYVQRVSAGALLAIVLGAFLTGLLVFWLFTRRLSQLTANVKAFTDSGFGEHTPGPTFSGQALPDQDISIGDSLPITRRMRSVSWNSLSERWLTSCTSNLKT